MNSNLKYYFSAMRVYVVLLVASFLSFGCVNSISDFGEDFTLCASSADFFEPTNKTFIAPGKSSFIDTICTPPSLEDDLTFIDLTSEKVCLLEQHLAMMSDSLSAELCQDVKSVADLDAYHYQYVGLRMGQQDYIFVNAFQDPNVDSTDWTREPYIGNVNNGINQYSVLFNLDKLSFEQFQSQITREVFYVPGFPYDNLDCARCISIQDLEPFQLDQSELCLLENNMGKLKEEVSVGCYNTGNMVNLEAQWLFQYMGVQKNGRRWIYINSELVVRPNSEQQKKERVLEFYAEFIPVGCDGGRNFWGVLFDLDTLEFEDLQFNR